MTKDEALRMALEALQSDLAGQIKKGPLAITAIREALAQPERPWVGLTDEDIGRCFDGADGTMGGLISAIEAKLREKNA